MRQSERALVRLLDTMRRENRWDVLRDAKRLVAQTSEDDRPIAASYLQAFVQRALSYDV